MAVFMIRKFVAVYAYTILRIDKYRKVSWIRHRDLHLLTVGRFTYTSDQRFICIHNPMTEDWTLQIRYPQRRDSGVYECQVGTTPPSEIQCTFPLWLPMQSDSRNTFGVLINI
ncbi:hypothetical protein NQ317_002194 [Molorchus minor]|uniref:Ig-like domain-containing protein n=1 Tax=Molorchus minor TaxID=1323400 RepID=A0ABQ9JD10_9CUCU|nr:hypothetical protein NQ317_002194 [Molorchus minor]